MKKYNILKNLSSTILALFLSNMLAGCGNNIAFEEGAVVNNTPVATLSAFTTNEDTTYNGLLTATDENGDILVYTLETSSSHGTITANTDGKFVYTPNAHYFGTDSFSYKVNDGRLDSETKIVNITVSGVNDSPIITSSASFTVDENQASSLVITATDADNESLTYNLNGTDSSSFTIDSTTGIVTFITQPDYELKTSYTFIATVSDATTSSSQTITVSILNIIDTLPILSNSVGMVSENAIAGTVVGSVIIPNGGDSAITSVTLSGTGNENFTVANDGTITVKAGALLDYETKTFYALTAIATNIVGNSASVTVDIFVTNVADVVPILAASTGTIVENSPAGTAVGNLIISSIGDSAITAITLSGSANENFIVAKDGTITVKAGAAIDYETKTSYGLTAIATNTAGNSVGVAVEISVSDIADVFPTLAASTGTIVENSPPDTAVGNVTISNAGDSAITAITLSGSGYENFTVANDGTITVKAGAAIDYETTTLFTLTAIATNTAGSSVSAAVDISVTNVADVVPTLAASLASVAENTTAGSVTGSVTISNAGDSAITAITLSGTGSEKFAVATTGAITVKAGAVLDYELKDLYVLKATAINEAGNSVSVGVYIDIINIADVLPTLAASTGTIVENSPAGTAVGNVIISNAGDSAITAITLSGSGSTNFTVATNGAITVNAGAVLDYETKTLFSLTAIATNTAGSSVSAAVDISVTNIADVVPTLAASTGSVAENSPAGTAVGNVTISNAGDSAITAITLSGTGSEKFAVATNGAITVKAGAILDFETTNLYMLKATATNTAGTSVLETLYIAISNVADVVPILAASTGSVAENSPAGTAVGNVIISNAGDSAITAITLSGIGSTNFTVATNGAITVNAGAVLDYETKTLFSLTAIATNTAGDSVSVAVNINIFNVYEAVPIEIPTLVVIMNWTNYSENDPSVWHNKIFNKEDNSVNRWFYETTDGELQLVPVTENSGTADDGVIIVTMGKNHPGGYNDATFRDTEITNAITNTEVVNNVDFALLDTDGDGSLNRTELQIIFIVAGGEESYGDAIDHSIWAHAWAFESTSTLSVDGVKVMRYDGTKETSGGYARFGANHDTHKATIGIIAHELGHSLLALGDYYDNSGGSGLGWYDVMSNGSWAAQATDTYAGDTPTQYSAYNRVDAGFDINVTDVNASQDLTIKCSSRELIKLVTTKTNEYFLIECRDTAKLNSDISFETADSSFTSNKLFAMLYHVDTLKTGNTEDDIQTSINHYKVALVEKDSATLMTYTANIDADYADVYVSGDLIDTTKTKLYDATATGYSIEILNEDYTDRTMTIRITK